MSVRAGACEAGGDPNYSRVQYVTLTTLSIGLSLRQKQQAGFYVTQPALPNKCMYVCMYMYVCMRAVSTLAP